MANPSALALDSGGGSDARARSRKSVWFEAWRAEVTARYLWGFLRPLLGRGLVARCRRCVLPESYAGLDSAGLCPECAAPPAADAERCVGGSDLEQESELEALLQGHQRAGRGRFDALLLLSGGKDSAYLLHRIRRDYPGLRVLTVLVDNGFLSPYATANVERLLSRFDVSHLTLRPDRSFVRNAFRFALTHLHRQQNYSIVDHFDGQMTFDAARQLAAELAIPLVLTGLGKEQARLVLGATSFELPRQEELAQRQEVAGISMDELERKTGDVSHWWDGTRWPADRVARVVSPLWVWDPSEEQILAELAQQRLLPPRATSPLLTNNALIPLIGMAEVARFGYCCWEVEFSRQVRRGAAPRNYWLALFQLLELSARTGSFIGRSVDQTLSELGLSREAIGISVGGGGSMVRGRL